MNRKSLFSIMMCIFTFAISLCFVGCGPEEPHEHTQESGIYYTIEEEDSSKQVYSYKKCECGETFDKTKVENAVIVTPENAQEKIDSDLNNKVVVFDGVFTEELTFRPTIATAEIYALADTSKAGVENVKQWTAADLLFKAGLTEEVDGVKPLTSTSIGSYADGTNKTKYNYVRKFENIIFTATEDTEFQNKFYFMSRAGQNSGSNLRYDPIRQEAVTAQTIQQFWQHLTLDNVTFHRLNFKTVIVNEGQSNEEKHQGQIFISNQNTINNANIITNKINNITVSNCSFKDPTWTDSTESNAAVYIQSGGYSNEDCVNFVYKDNTVDGNFQGVHIKNVKNATFSGNVIKNTNSNAIACQSSTQNDENIYASGTIIIENNIIDNVHDNYHTLTGDEATTVELGGDRPFRFGRVKNAEIIIRNNTITNCYNQYMAIQSFGEGSTCKSTNNTYNGNAITETDDAGSSENLGYKLYIPGYPVAE